MTKEFQEVGLLLGQVEHQRPLPGDTEQMNPDKIVEDPPRCRALYPAALVIGKRGLMGLERLAETVFQGGIHQSTPGHHQEQRHEALWLFEVGVCSGYVFMVSTT